eukprot:gene17487-23040_t
MQVYTYNSRVKIFDNKPANILVNYLVYPGSSGSNIHDLIVADKIVIPPEHARYYSESLLLLPSTYQISYYESTNYPIDQQSQADIFLDTFIYGAHSTATDALKGGLPLITLLGDAFSSRVVKSTN